MSARALHLQRLEPPSDIRIVPRLFLPRCVFFAFFWDPEATLASRVSPDAVVSDGYGERDANTADAIHRVVWQCWVSQLNRCRAGVRAETRRPMRSAKVQR